VIQRMKEDFRNFIYKVENIVDELVIVLLSLGAIVVAIYSMFFYPEGVNFMQLGRLIFWWLTPLGLMIIGRELWLMNRKMHSHVYEGEEGGE
jgi:hypothetical protein